MVPYAARVLSFVVSYTTMDDTRVIRGVDIMTQEKNTSYESAVAAYE